MLTWNTESKYRHRTRLAEKWETRTPDTAAIATPVQQGARGAGSLVISYTEREGRAAGKHRPLRWKAQGSDPGIGGL